MTDHDPTKSPPTDTPGGEEPAPEPATETEHIEEDGEPLGANFV